MEKATNKHVLPAGSGHQFNDRKIIAGGSGIVGLAR